MLKTISQVGKEVWSDITFIIVAHLLLLSLDGVRVRVLQLLPFLGDLKASVPLHQRNFSWRPHIEWTIRIRTLINASAYYTQGLCRGIDLRGTSLATLMKLVPSERRKIGAAVSECLLERLEITSYALEFGFLHDDVIDTNINDASLDEIEQALEQGGRTGEIKEKRASGSGKREIAAEVIPEMMAIEPERVMVVVKSWVAGFQYSNRRQDDTDLKTLEEYIPYRSLGVGYILGLIYYAIKALTRLVTFGCAITIPEEDADEVKELLMPALTTASLPDDLFSFEKEKDDANVQIAVLVVMREHGCSEEEAREICRKRIRIEVANYYILSGNVAWSALCPRYNAGAKWNELQLLRAEHSVAKYPATWPPKDAIGGLSVKTERKRPHVNGNGVYYHSVGHYESTTANGHKRKRNGDCTGDEIRMNGTNVSRSRHL